jgi:hypothetical protein
VSKSAPRIRPPHETCPNGHKPEEIEMRRIVAGLFMSLDGVVEAPETWHFP